MKDYKYCPLEGLQSIRKEEVLGKSFSNTLSFIDEHIITSPKGRASKLFIYFYLINLMQENNLSFLVKGGIIMHYYLKDHTRPTNDIDIIINDYDDFIKKLEKVFKENKREISFVIKKSEKLNARCDYYYNTFNMKIDCFLCDNFYTTIILDGIYGDVYNNIESIKYKGIDIIKDKSFINGTPIEYVLSEKIIAITNELLRPIKHLIDVYSLIKEDINKELLKKYLLLISDNDNKVRNQFGKDNYINNYQIRDNKDFSGSFIFSSIQAGYNISFKEMKDEVNKYLSNLYK